MVSKSKTRESKCECVRLSVLQEMAMAMNLKAHKHAKFCTDFHQEELVFFCQEG